MPPATSPDEPAIAQPFPERRLGDHRARWLATVSEGFREMERRIDMATTCVRLETYLMREEGPATWLRAALLRARERGVAVRVLLDAFGCEGLRPGFLQPLRDAGVEVAIFNPQRALRRMFRNHRKLLAIDAEHAIVGGFNIAPEYAGDGVTHGWCDTGVYVGGPVVAELERCFDAHFALSRFTPGAYRQFHKEVRAGFANGTDNAVAMLVSGPGLPRHRLLGALRRDLAAAHNVWIASAYFLPGLRIRRLLYRVARGTGRVRILLAGRTDVPLARMASERLYRRLLSRRVRIREYQPQILHAKLVIMDDVVHVGSCNLDRRSLHINYELLLRFDWPELAADARQWYRQAQAHALPVNRRRWKATRSAWRQLRSRFAYWLLTRIDPYLARRGFRSMS